MEETTTNAPDHGARGHRSVARLAMLHSLGTKLNAMREVQGIGAAITAELGTIIDYHNCRVYALAPDGATLRPIAFQGEFSTEYETETFDELVTEVGEGITGWVAKERRSLLTPDARTVEFAVTIPGTEDDLLESMLAVPMLAGDETMGVIVLSSLGYGMFDEDDQRVLEVLAGHAGVAMQNARLLAAEREAAATAETLLGLSKALTARRTVGDIFQDALESLTNLVNAVAAGAYVHDTTTGDFRLARLHVTEGATARPRASIADVPWSVAEGLLLSERDPFVVPPEITERLPSEFRVIEHPGEVLVTPLRWGVDGVGGIVAISARGGPGFTERDIALARGMSDITTLALGTARRLSELERFHELVESLDAVFWEADADDLRLTFLGGRAEEILGQGASAWPDRNTRWGDHVAADDRDDVIDVCRRAINGHHDATVEYRVPRDDVEHAWIRDLIHVVEGSAGPRQLRGLMVDVTDRKLAEQALRTSERKYSEAFRREREAAQRLRALDDMKNTFLEAVSHDLRTPLTSILGSALTLEQSNLDLPRDDALDLVRRVAGNARKLQRLLGDLLDLDRLQRGIVTPQRRPYDLRQLIGTAVAETDNPQGRDIHLDVDDATIDLDGAKVERIVENLVSNALRHTDRGAQIWVRARRQDGGVLLTVEDDGAGIPDELKEEVFEAFRQAPGSAAGHSPGVGIGLSLVKRFAELHGGSAWIEDRPGGGSVFNVSLPA